MTALPFFPSMKFRFYNAILTALLVGAALAACGGKDQRRAAGRIVRAAHDSIGATKILIEKTEARNRTLFDADIQTVSELADYKLRMRNEAQEIVANYAEASADLKKIAGKFDEAAALDVPDFYQDYARARAAEFRKRAEAFDIRKGNAQALIDIESPQRMTDRFDENNSRFEKLMREADEMAAAAAGIEIENRDFFAEFKAS